MTVLAALRSRLFRPSVAAVAVVIVAAGCSAPTPTADPLDATYGIEASGCSAVSAFGSGIGVAPDLIMTTAHTVAGATGLVVHGEASTSWPATLVAIDPDLDLAVLRLDTAVAFLDRRNPDVGEEAWLLTWSNDEGRRARSTVVRGLLRVTIEDIYLHREGSRRAIEVSGPVVAGDSGGAVVGTDGRIIGLVYAASRERSVGFALRNEELDRVVASVGQPVPDLPCGP